MNPYRMPKTRSFWPTLRVKNACQKVDMSRHFQVSRASQPMGCWLHAVISYCKAIFRKIFCWRSFSLMMCFLKRFQQVARGQAATDYRFFVRSIIRHSDLVTKEASFDYLENESERTVLEAMDALEIASSDFSVSVEELHSNGFNGHLSLAQAHFLEFDYSVKPSSV